MFERMFEKTFEKMFEKEPMLDKDLMSHAHLSAPVNAHEITWGNIYA